MISHLENYTVPIRFGKESTEIQDDLPIQSINEPALLILETHNVLRPVLLDHSKVFQACICGFHWVTTLFGSYFRYILYQYIFNQYKKKELNPIDILTLILSLSQHIAAIIQTLWLTSMAILDAGLDHWIGGTSVCTILRHMFLFDMYYSIVGSLGISIYRILYIKMDSWVKYGIGETKLFCIILLIGMAIPVILELISIPMGYPNYVPNTCTGIPRWKMIQILRDYDHSGGNPTTHAWRNVNLIRGALGMGMTVAEICIYITFFHFVFKHDNNKRLRQLLDPSVIRKRNRRNAITFFSQFCSFVLEFTFTLLIILDSVYGPVFGGGPFVVAMKLKATSFATMSAIEVLTSCRLRSRLFKHWTSIKSIIKNQ